MTIRAVLLTLAVLVVFLMFYESLAAAASTPAEFPRVTPVQQESRDVERRRILEDELKNEQASLVIVTAKKDAAAMARHSADIESIKSELGKKSDAKKVSITAVIAAEPIEKVPDAFGSQTPEAFGMTN